MDYPVVKYEYMPTSTRHTRLSATSSFHGCIQVTLPTLKSPDFWVDSEGWISEWIHVSLPTQVPLVNSAIGEVVICHKSTRPNQSRVFTLYPVVVRPDRSEKQTMDSFFHLYAKDQPLEGTLVLSDWIPSNVLFYVYGKQLFKSNQPIYIQSANLFHQSIWAKPVPMFRLAPTLSPVLYKGTGNTRSPADQEAGNVCGLEGFRKLRRRLKKMKQNDPAKPSSTSTNENQEERVKNSAIMDRLGSLSENVKNLTYLITYGATETANTLGDTGEKIKQTADGVRQTSMDVQTAKNKIQEVDAKVNEIQGIMQNLTDGNKIMVNADGTFTKITDAIRQNSVVGPVPAAPTNPVPVAPTNPVPAAPTNPAEEVPTNPGMPMVEGFEEFECHEDGGITEEVEMYNIPVGSAFASSLSDNAAIRMGGALMLLGTIIIFNLVITPVINSGLINIFDPNSTTKANAEKDAAGALIFIELIPFFGFMLVAIAGGTGTELAVISIMLFVVGLSLAYTCFVIAPKKDHVPMISISPFFKFPDSDALTTIGLMCSAIGVVGLLIGIILSLIGAVDANASSIVKWVFFVVCMAGVYLILGNNILSHKSDP